MAGTLLHIVLAENALDRSAIPESAKREIRDSLFDFRLGAVLFDLPYYEHLVLQAISRAVRRDYHFNAWGGALHSIAPLGLCRCLLTLASTSPARALALGALTHAAVDVVFHPEIERRVSLSTTGRLAPNRTHCQIETQMDICVHNKLLGHQGIGTAYTCEALRITPHKGWAPLLMNAIKKTHKKSPSLRIIGGWLHGLHLFAISHADSRFFWVSSKHILDADRDAEALRLAEEATNLAARYLTAGFDYLTKACSLTQFSALVPDVDLVFGTKSNSFP